MSFPDKQDGVSKDEWVAKLEDGSHIQRVSMNNLIMNYLVTGKLTFCVKQIAFATNYFDF